MQIKCGDANPNGNISFKYKGGCGKGLDIKDAYRCTGCGGWFHKDCILKHFELEKEHDYGRQKERERIKKIIKKQIEKYNLRSHYGNLSSEVLKQILKELK